MPHSKVPGGPGASEKELKKEAQKHGVGAPNAAGHTKQGRPGDAPVASDSGSTFTGTEPGSNQPGEQGIKGEPVVDTKPASGGANMK